ncbi:hypothetical protein Q8G38_10460 [Halomonas venusta]|uniref:ATP-binding protein n=1 Tax=Vreelandella venusta TaxID=44935 RepID=UPI00295F1A48|nr:hypothetical protein [Halomonas venusta]MDW0359738.1 hypothetical protein [Halomonas venusta]
MAEAAKNDGADVEWLTYSIFIASKDGVSIPFYETRALDTHNAFALSLRKDLARALMLKKDIPMPLGQRCASIDEAVGFWTRLKTPIVIKPVAGVKGRGVTVGANSVPEIEEACVRAGMSKRSVMVEEMVTGTEYRVMVLGEKPIGALYKDPANVVGDGASTVRQLIKRKNAERLENPNLSKYLIKAGQYVVNNLRKQGLTLDSVPQESEKIYLRKEANLSTGGDSIDAFDQLPSSVFDVCVRAVTAIPGLELGGVDVFYDKEKDLCNVIEAWPQKLSATPEHFAKVLSHVLPRTQH